MRFDRTKKFKIKDLDLDQGNYRFRKATDQRECVEKIYHSNPSNFKTIMSSIAEEDIGELLLVYESPEGGFIVMDGNRRASALKVLDNPDWAPSDSIRKLAIELNEKFEIKKEEVQAQISSDKNAILRTIYERHGSSGGKTRLSWPSMAKSRFGYDHELGIPDWRPIALLYELEKIDPSLSARLESKKFKYDVFRQIIPAAINQKILSAEMFSERDKKIKKSKQSLVRKAHKHCLVFFDDIESDAITYSRTSGGIYANSDGLKIYLRKFISSSPENPSPPNDTGPDKDDPNEPPQSPPSDDNPPTNPPSDPVDTSPRNPSNNGILHSLEIKQSIERTKSKKLEQLYNSICTVSLRQHSSLVVLGAWALLEALSTALGKDDGKPIDAFFSKNNINNHLWPNVFKKTQTDDFRNALEFIRKEANAIKHSCTYRSDNASHLNAHFECLEPLLLRILEKVINDKIKMK